MGNICVPLVEARLSQRVATQALRALATRAPQEDAPVKDVLLYAAAVARVAQVIDRAWLRDRALRGKAGSYVKKGDRPAKHPRNGVEREQVGLALPAGASPVAPQSGGGVELV